MCTLAARLITRWLRRPRALVVRAWAWLCAHTDDLDEKQRCLTAIVELDPEPEWARLALQHVRERQAQMNWGSGTWSSSVYAVEAKRNPRNSPLTQATFALIKDPYKLIHYLGYDDYDSEYELYDLANDPEEMDNLVTSNKSLARELQGKLKEKLDEVNRPYVKQ